MRRLIALSFVIAWSSLGWWSRCADGEDWPQFRGPRGDGTWQAPELPEAWPAAGLTPRWKIAIGGGYSGISIVAGRVYTMDRQLEPEQRERVLCFDAATGNRLWEHAYPVDYADLDYGNGPRAQPTVHAGNVYTVGALGDVRCLDAATGRENWRKSYQQDFAGRLPMWGYAGSPVLDRGQLILVPGGSTAGMVALNLDTGAELWRSLKDEAGYCTPLVTSVGNETQIVHWTPSHIRCVAAADGAPRWSYPYEITYGVSIAKPIVHEGLVFVAGYWAGSRAIHLGPQPVGGTLAWVESRYLRGLMSQPLYREGFVYLLDKQYGLTCFDLATGSKRWDDGNQMTPRGRNPQASLVWLGQADRAILLNSEGELILARLNPAGYQETGRTTIVEPTWAHPAFAGDRVYARSDSELVCVPLR